MRTGIRRKPSTHARAAAVIAAISFVSVLAAPQATPRELFLSARKVVLDEKTRTSELLLINRTQTAASYRLSLIEMVMTEDGRLERLPTDVRPDTSAKPLVKFAPQQLRLQPGASQLIRIAAPVKSSTKPGEYRSHLQIEMLPKVDTPSQTPESLIAIRFTMVPAITIPIIYRSGKTTAGAEISNAKISGNLFTANLLRSGNRSIRGEFNVYFEPTNKKKRVAVGTIRELAVYFPNSLRRLSLTVAVPKQAADGKGRYVAQFAETSLRNGARATAIVGDAN